MASKIRMDLCDWCRIALITNGNSCDDAILENHLQDTWEAWGALCMLLWVCTATS